MDRCWACQTKIYLICIESMHCNACCAEIIWSLASSLFWRLYNWRKADWIKSLFFNSMVSQKPYINHKEKSSQPSLAHVSQSNSKAITRLWSNSTKWDIVRSMRGFRKCLCEIMLQAEQNQKDLKDDAIFSYHLNR